MLLGYQALLLPEPKWAAVAQSENLEYYRVFTWFPASSSILKWLLSGWYACPDSGRLCPMDISARQEHGLIASARDKKENGSMPVFPFRSRYCGFLGKAYLLQWE